MMAIKDLSKKQFVQDRDENIFPQAIPELRKKYFVFGFISR